MLICTGDRDALQLVNDHVTVLYPRAGVSELTRFTPEEVEAKYGLTPAQYPDFAALRGDPSDNLPGIPGVGEKTAAKWVREYGSLDAAGRQGRHGQGQGRRRAAREPRPASLRNRRLTELVRDVPLDVERRRPGPAAVGPRRGAHAVRRPAVPGAARAAVRHASPRAEPEAEEGFDVDRRPARRRTRSTGWLDEHARDGAPGRAWRSAARGAAAPATLTGVALAAADGAAGLPRCPSR